MKFGTKLSSLKLNHGLVMVTSFAFVFGLCVFALPSLGYPAQASGGRPCKDLPTHRQVLDALTQAVGDGNGGIFVPNAMWVTLVGRDGMVCVVAKIGDAWPGSRVVSAQKANTANAFSNDRLSLSTANLYSAVQPGGNLFGLQESNPVNAVEAYAGQAASWGGEKDPLVGRRPGGVNVFGGGLALYRKGSKSVLGGLGVSGDSSCSDHIVAWRIRSALGLDAVVGGVSSQGDDNIIYDISESGKSAGGFGHPTCSPKATEIAKTLATVKK
ncbi:MAG: heme-binding protein [Proteobacteria bacterium]|nr:heme-binding protein [Pseudomonadota bacterium]